MDDVQIWNIIHSEIVVEKMFSVVDDTFWIHYKNNYEPTIDVEIIKEYYDTYMKNSLHSIGIERTKMLELFEVLKIEIPKLVKLSIENKFSLILKLDENQCLLDYDYVQNSINAERKYPIQSEREAAQRNIQRRFPFTMDDKLSMLNFLFAEMEKAVKNNKKIKPKGDLIWRDYRRAVSKERGVRNLRSHQILSKNLYKMPMAKEKILKMYKHFEIDVTDTRREICEHLNVNLKLMDGKVKNWEYLDYTKMNGSQEEEDDIVILE